MAHSYMPQKVDKNAWYYENNGSIDLIVMLADIPSGHIGRARKGTRRSTDGGYLHIRIPSRMLLNTLKRQGKAK